MSHTRNRAAPVPRDPSPAPQVGAARTFRLTELLLIAACIAVSLWVHRATTTRYFSPDDLTYLARVQGLSPAAPAFWRFLSGVAYFRIVFPWFGVMPAGYLAVNLVLHAANVALLYVAARTWGASPAGATLAAGLFGASRLALTTLSQAVTIAEPMALVLALGALLVASRPGNWRVAIAALLFTLALEAKETVVLLPLLLFLTPGRATFRERSATAALVLAPGLLLGLLFQGWRHHEDLFRHAYENAFGANLFFNAATLAGWSADLQNALPDLVTTTSTGAWRTGLVFLVLLVVIAVAAWRRTRLPALGALWWMLALGPVLPFLWQRYLHYLYVPLAGLSLAAGGVLEWALVRRRAKAGTAGGSLQHGIAWIAVVLLLFGYAATSNRLLEERGRVRFEPERLPVDPFLQKQELARRAVASMTPVMREHPGPVVVLFLHTSDEQPFAWRMKTILGEGLGLRAVVPGIPSARFVTAWDDRCEEAEVFVAENDGGLSHLGHGIEARRRLPPGVGNAP